MIFLKLYYVISPVESWVKKEHRQVVDEVVETGNIRQAENTDERRGSSSPFSENSSLYGRLRLLSKGR